MSEEKEQQVEEKNKLHTKYKNTIQFAKLIPNKL